jgi:hypothetical protein
MHADIDARERDCRCKQKEKGSKPRRCEGQDGGRSEARRRVSGRKRGVVWDRHERFRFRVANGWPRPVEEGFQARCRPVRDGDGDNGHKQNAPSSPEEGQNQGDRDPDETQSPCPGEPLEDRIQPTRAMVDDPALEMTVRGDQAGTICFVCSTSARRSKGFPTKPCAPRSAASSPASS